MELKIQMDAVKDSSVNDSDPVPGTSTSSYHTSSEAVYEGMGISSFGTTGITLPTPTQDLKIRLRGIGSWTLRQNMDTNVLKHWEIMKEKDKEIYELAMIALAAPASQVSVERSFSCLPLVVSPKRTRLGSDLITAVCMIRINSHFMANIYLRI